MDTRTLLVGDTMIPRILCLLAFLLACCGVSVPRVGVFFFGAGGALANCVVACCPLLLLLLFHVFFSSFLYSCLAAGADSKNHNRRSGEYVIVQLQILVAIDIHRQTSIRVYRKT